MEPSIEKGDYLGVVRQLLKHGALHGADVEAKDEIGMRPRMRHNAVARGTWHHPRGNQRSFLDHGANAHIEDKSGSSPFQVAIEWKVR
jgi:hypothetical protein